MSFRNTILTVILNLLCGCAAALADEAPQAADDSTSKTRVLLFRSGRALEGLINETGTHYVVVRPIGKVEIAKSDVELVAANLDEVYRHKLARINDGDPDEHMRLAQWCMVVNLREHAIKELERCVDLATNTTRAKALLENLRRTPKPADRATQPPANQEPTRSESTPAARTFPSFQRELSTAHVSTFSVQVQPMLVRSCGTAGCHDGNHAGPLVLQGSSRATQRTSQQNLRSVLAQIDPEEPELSPLLLESLRPHGTAQRSPFVNGLSDPAFAKLSDWVRAVSGKLATKPTSTAQITDTAAPSSEQAEAIPKSTGKETSPPNLVYSNKPIAQTSARLRAGMTPANSPTDSGASRPAAKKNDRPSEHPAEQEPDIERPAATPTDSKSVSTKPDPKPTSIVRRSDRNPLAQPPVPDKPPPDSYQPIDPFDPKIFNRQFAPR